METLNFMFQAPHSMECFSTKPHSYLEAPCFKFYFSKAETTIRSEVVAANLLKADSFYATAAAKLAGHSPRPSD